jgi:hypothetical protein
MELDLPEMKWLLASSAVLVVIVLLGSSIAPTLAAPGEGTVQLVVRGYPVHGSLQNAAINSEGNVSMRMIVDGNVQTPIGGVPMTASGAWVGVRNGSMLSGSIQNVAGRVHICIWFWCGNANFVGQGHWSGTLTGTSGAGTFDGTITFTSSDFSQIPVNQPQPVSGTWNAEFQLP